MRIRPESGRPWKRRDGALVVADYPGDNEFVPAWARAAQTERARLTARVGSLLDWLDFCREKGLDPRIIPRRDFNALPYRDPALIPSPDEWLSPLQARRTNSPRWPNIVPYRGGHK